MTETAESHSDGFTLVEVLVALAILALAFGLAFTALSGGAVGLGRADDRQRAAAIAETVMTRVGHDIAVQDGRRQGADGGYRWVLDIAPYGDGTGAEPDGLVGHMVVVTVFSSRSRGAGLARLTSLRLAPNAVAR